MYRLRKDMTILFQGDSVTDCGRRREGEGLGFGYVFMIASRLWAARPELNLRVLNRGISGNRSRDLRARWQEDALDLKPDMVSILIGINDTWRRYDRNDPTPADRFDRDYRAILESTRAALGDIPLILLEPFLLPYPDDRRGWRDDLDPKIAVVRDLAREFGATLVPLDGIFAAASAVRDCAYWTSDGVHPTVAGQGLIAKAWLDRSMIVD